MGIKVKRDLELRRYPAELARFAEFWPEGPWGLK